jgi:hypothetical protein
MEHEMAARLWFAICIAHHHALPFIIKYSISIHTASIYGPGRKIHFFDNRMFSLPCTAGKQEIESQKENTIFRFQVSRITC